MPLNLAGLKIGHATNTEFHTGCTVVLCPSGTVGSVDVRGPAPGSREFALLGPDKPYEKEIHAVVLTGGSAFGLATADGVMRYLFEHDIGHQTPIMRVPIVPAAVVFDLGFGRGQLLPDAAMGYAACEAANSGEPILQGNVGAGAGVTIGKWCGFDGLMKGGFGVANCKEGDLEVTAVAVVNAIGDIVNEDGSVLAGSRNGNGGWSVEQYPQRYKAFEPPLTDGMHTTLVVVATNARLSKTETNRLASRAHDGLAIAVRPAHMRHDGDTIFALSTGRIEVDNDLVSNLAVLMTAEAIRNGVRHAVSVGSVPGLADK
ncbi:MAG: P1 family peptidase [Anaerolineales bacterium]|nr:P1 family peptidase [Anaerolineales bacterium]